MEIIKSGEGSVLNVSIEGRLDTTTAPELENFFADKLDGVTELHLDFSKLEYISSAGLRILLSLQKKMNNQGKMDIKNVSADISEVFEITGFDSILTVL